MRKRAEFSTSESELHLGGGNKRAQEQAPGLRQRTPVRTDTGGGEAEDRPRGKKHRRRERGGGGLTQNRSARCPHVGYCVTKVFRRQTHLRSKLKKESHAYEKVEN